MPVTDNNRKQAHILSDSDPLPNDTGLAVGVALVHGDHLFIVLPGPPRELKPMFERYAKAWIRKQMGEETPLFSKILKFAGIGESALEQELEDLIRNQHEVTIAPYAQEGEVALRLSTKAEMRTRRFSNSNRQKRKSRRESAVICLPSRIFRLNG